MDLYEMRKIGHTAKHKEGEKKHCAQKKAEGTVSNEGQ